MYAGFLAFVGLSVLICLFLKLRVQVIDLQSEIVAMHSPYWEFIS